MPPSSEAKRRLRLLLRTARAESAAWQAAFRAAMPDAQFAVWPDVPFDADYVAAWKPPAELFARIARPKAIFNLGAGADVLLALSNLPLDVPVIRLEDAGMAEQMAQYVALAVLAAHRQWSDYAAQQRRGAWSARSIAATRDFPVTLLGLGVLGRACAERLRGFGYPLRGWSRERRSLPAVTTFAGFDELAAALAGSRAVICLLPSTPHTRDLLDAARLKLLAPGAHVINVARGDLVVDADLVALLDAGHLAGATLDVFRTEPLPPEHPFWHHPKIVVTPHVSAVTRIEESVAQVADKIARLERGETVTGVVDRQRGY